MIDSTATKRPSSLLPLFCWVVLGAALSTTGCSPPLKRNDPPVDCAQADAYDFEAIKPDFWFGFGDDTPTAYDGSEYFDNPACDVRPGMETKTNCYGDTVTTVKEASRPPNPAELVNCVPEEDRPLRCGNAPELFLKTYGHEDWGSAWGSELKQRTDPYAPDTGESPLDYEGLALWAKSERGADKGLMFIVETRQTIKPNGGERKLQTPKAPDGTPICGEVLRDKYGDPVLYFDENGKPLTDEEGHALQDYPGDCKQPTSDQGAATYRMDTNGNLILSSGVPEPDDCGNSFRHLLYTTDEWKLYLFPFSSFWQEADPNRDPAGMDPTAIYQLAFRAEKETHIEMWIQNLSFYRHVGYEPPGGRGGRGGASDTDTNSTGSVGGASGAAGAGDIE